VIESDMEVQEKQRAKKHQQYLNDQIATKTRRVSGARKTQLQEAKAYQAQEQFDATVFRQYADVQINGYASIGRSTMPMKLDLMRHDARQKKVSMGV
jgi:hypothetical protein